MKKQIDPVMPGDGKHFSSRSLQLTAQRLLLFAPVILLSVFLFTSCKKETDTSTSAAENSEIHSVAAPIPRYQGLSSQTIWELQQARSHTARYHDTISAIQDCYVNINVIVPEMGYHFLKPALLDADFDFRYPEILVFNREENGEMRLVAVEYAVPLSLSQNEPEGFSGDNDHWDIYQGELWTLHAWVWEYNPLGVFNPTNPSIHVH